MNAVLYYSNAGECKRIAEYLADKTGYEIGDILSVTEDSYDRIIVVFPVYCQNVPRIVGGFLSRISCQYLTLIAAYGKMSYGNVLYEIQREHRHRIIAAAYVPTKHSYVDEERFEEFDKLDLIADKLNDVRKHPTTVQIPKSSKNPFANFAPAWRSRQGVKIVRGEQCNGCGTCNSICPLNAINCGKTNNKCIRCMKCVVNCPNKALTLKLSQAMRAYLSKRKRDELVIYI